MKHQLLDLIRSADATIYDPDFGGGREGWRARSPEEHTELGVLEWVRQLQKIEPDSPTPSISPATELMAVTKALKDVGYEWRLQARDSYGNPVTRLHVRPANNSLEERIIEHVCWSLKGMEETPSMWGTRDAREATCFELMVVRWLASGQETQVDEVRSAWEKAVAKVGGVQGGNRTLCDRFADQSEEEFTDALMTVVAHVKTRLPLQGARLRQFEKREERRVGMDPTAIKALSKKIDAYFRRISIVVVRHDDHESYFRPVTISETMAMAESHQAAIKTNLECSPNVGWPVGVVFGATDNKPLSSSSDGIWICCVDTEGAPQWRGMCQTCFDMGARMVGAQIETWPKNAADRLSDNGSWLEINPTIDAIRLLLQKQSA